MADKMPWEDFQYEYIEKYGEIGAQWVDSDRTKTIAALRHLWENIPKRDLDRLPNHLAIFAPTCASPGGVYLLHNVGVDAEHKPMKGLFIYFGPELEEKSQHLVDLVVAHEFAHAILHDLGKPIPKEEAPAGFGAKRELQADALAAEWGFARPREISTRQRRGRRRKGQRRT